MQVTPHGGLANRCTRPLCDLSVATAGDMLSRGRLLPGPGAIGCRADADWRDSMRAPRPPMSQAASEAALRAVTIGELAVLGGPVTLVEYDPAWPAQFEHEAARIRSALGERVRLLEHAGSTSVPGLAAKPIIDI